MNAWWEPLEFVLPATRPQAKWQIEIDTYEPASPTLVGDQVTVGPRSVVVLLGPREEPRSVREKEKSIDPERPGRTGPYLSPGKVNAMSAGKFWTRSRARVEDSKKATAAGALARTGPLTARDRCDRCGAQAYVRVLLPSGLELLFCTHHNRQHASALAKAAVDIQDETGRLTRMAA